MSTVSRRIKWHPTPPPPPSPKILHISLSRRSRRKQTKPTAQHQYIRNNPLLLMHQKYPSYREKLENLFDQENNKCPMELLSSNTDSKRRERVEEQEEDDCGDYNGGRGAHEFEEEKWRFQAEILRAECNFLRMEREFAMQKLGKNRVKMERTLRSTVQTLVSGRKKIFEGKNVNSVLEEEIEDLAEKLEDLQKSSRIKDHEVRNCSNFDTKACVLQRRLEKLGGLSNESCVKDLPELAVAESALPINTTSDIDKENIISNYKTKHKPSDVVMVRKEMEGLSKGILDGVEGECSSILCSTANSSVASCASTSKRIECPELSSSNNRQLYQEPMLLDNKCSGRCKAIVRRVVEQVKAETEQWSQMQEMLGQVRGEMEQLQTSRDFWENQAYNSDNEIQSLKRDLEEWKEKAVLFENKASELQLELSQIKKEIRKPKASSNVMNTSPVPLGMQLEKERHVLSCRFKKNHHQIDEEIRERITPTKDLPPLSLGKQLAREKKMIIRRLNENHRTSEKGGIQDVSIDGKRKHLRDIGNILSPLARQKSQTRRGVFLLHSPESCSFRK